MTPLPCVTRSTTSVAGGFASSRFGPTVPVAPASASVWHDVQPAVSNTCLPAVASPEGAAGVVVSPPPPPEAGGATSPVGSASTSCVCAAHTTVVICARKRTADTTMYASSLRGKPWLRLGTKIAVTIAQAMKVIATISETVFPRLVSAATSIARTLPRTFGRLGRERSPCKPNRVRAR